MFQHVQGGCGNGDYILALQILIKKRLYHLNPGRVIAPPASVSTCTKGRRDYIYPAGVSTMHFKVWFSHRHWIYRQFQNIMAVSSTCFSCWFSRSNQFFKPQMPNIHRCIYHMLRSLVFTQTPDIYVRQFQFTTAVSSMCLGCWFSHSNQFFF